MFSYFAEKLNVQNLGELFAPTLTPEQELHAAIEGGLEEKFMWLLDEQKIDPNVRNAAGNLPIHTASYYGRVKILEVLLGHNVDVNAVGPRENTPLHFAASQGHEEAVRFLVNSGANPAVRNRNGRTPYDIAKGDRIRQYLLPLQFRHEDPSQAAALLPPGITPTVDPLAPRPVIAPPPMSGEYGMPAPAQQQAPHHHLYAAATHSAIPRAGAQSRITRGEYRPIQADGFGSSVGNEELTAKFGNTREIKVTAPPPSLMIQPPSSSNGVAPPVSSGGSNPYAAASRSASSSTPPAMGYGSAPNSNNKFARGPPQFKIFNPALAANNGSTSSGNAVAVNSLGSFGAAAPNVSSNSGLQRNFADPQEGQEEEVNLSANASVLQ